MVTRREVVEKRAKLYRDSVRSHTFNRGDKRVHSPRLCSICARPLSQLVVQEQRYVTSHRHTRVHLSGDIQINICTDVRSCYSRLEERGELTVDVNG